ncbi:PREDICTED: uncharacterized protein LOC106821287 isoform X2 [Priapulus caudatus]|uniref:Uncharacterized protein LOC106821287 isoform X2 n=1 Tax=Priapulus caudatus TaxID=37621 RepID=A0ABM1FB10_PRICU|nr:PREDICTED: uncharacterized protein LOC106821287 isoform X2 [Priapulus caudatus]
MSENFTDAKLQKLKVVDLKKELKTHGLSIVGNKSELIDRLKHYLREKHGLPKDEENIESEHGEQDDDEEEFGDELLEEVDSGEEGDVSIDADITLALTTGEKSIGSLDSSSAEEKQPVVDQANEKPTEFHEKVVLASLADIPAADRKAQRAQKFSNGSTALDKSSADPDTKKKLRAERFGLPLKSASQPITGGTESVKADPDKLSKRAERFGLVTKETIENKKIQRAKKFGISTSTTPVTTEAKKKRLEKFGQPA